MSIHSMLICAVFCYVFSRFALHLLASLTMWSLLRKGGSFSDSRWKRVWSKCLVGSVSCYSWWLHGTRACSKHLQPQVFQLRRIRRQKLWMHWGPLCDLRNTRPSLLQNYCVQHFRWRRICVWSSWFFLLPPTHTCICPYLHLHIYTSLHLYISRSIYLYIYL